ncbi:MULTISPECIES: Rrf2 family transcriptional regulator [unclassified Thioalkalivibrio]|uniref:Rrf2 family transcriptional regulator n=1 Tax=unclassified Thioalkalivibrio TaxID=2621013 RepID=UPI000364EC0F|nr:MULTISPECIES: Rrf2 family transcriptional regulator [unclassified Thioalkalivibrio]
MKLTTKGRYAVTAMLDVATHTREGPVSLAEVAGRQKLSLSYLEQLFSRLRKKGLVVSSRGPGGGYALSRDSAEISVAEIIVAVDEPVDVTRCGGKANCNKQSRCLTHDLWADLSDQLYDFLSNRSLAEVLERHEASVQAREQGEHPVTVHGSTGKENDHAGATVAAADRSNA